MHTAQKLRLKRFGEYCAAALLPGMTVFVSAHIEALNQTPLALSLILIALLARMLALGPAILAPICTAFSYHLVIVVPRHGWSVHATEIVRLSVILGLGFLITYFFHGLRETEKDLRLANKDLREKTEALVNSQQGSHSAAWSFHTKTRRTFWYEGGAELFGRSLEELTAMGSPTGLVHEDDRQKVAAAAEHTSRTGEPFQVEFRAVWPNGEIRWLEARGVPDSSEPFVWRGVTIDITNRKTAELALIRSEKLAAATRLASSVSHEINNPLESITNLVYLAKSSAVNPQTRSYLEDAEKEIVRIAQVTNQALRFHRQQSFPTEVDVTTMINSLLNLYGPRFIAAKICINLEAVAVPEVLCSAEEIKQAFGHLIQNALEAMPNGGNLRIRVRSVTDWRNGNPSVRVTIANSGNGMSYQTKKRIFEPFFTTKDGTNTGLGLWVTAGIIDRHGGSIQVWSTLKAPGSGAAFSVLLPLGLKPSLADELNKLAGA